MKGARIRVRGQVQGVGFRPYIWQLATEFALVGQVLNDPEGVLIEAGGDGLDGFLAALPLRAPPLARIEAIEVSALRMDAAKMGAGFSIAPSQGRGAQTRVAPDAATCPDCAAEVANPGRRRGYAFTNCTHCGPRFSILHGLPYDRAQTTMAGFTLCAACRAEYENPADRRFHAQPIACPVCGPRLWLEVGEQELGGDPIAGAAARLRAGEVVAIKGIGGFHLACDARNAAAVARLRLRKRRPAKPFAVMMEAADIALYAEVSAEEMAALCGAAAPVVLLAARGALPPEVAPGMNTLGVMLPYSPLHHLLLVEMEGPLVMTSANPTGAPQVIGNAEARRELSEIADSFLMHDREIARRLDDSVMRAAPPHVLRRARGMVPETLPLPPDFADGPQVLAFGAQMKAAICLVKAGAALPSHHLGDLDDLRSVQEYQRALNDYAALFDHAPQLLACDLHPGYQSTKIASDMAAAQGLPLIGVQHHHAHAAACMAENLWPQSAGPVAAIVLDGLGWGGDGTLWGGEVLLADYKGFERAAHLRPAPLAGGDAAARRPWHNALMRLDQAGLGAAADRIFDKLPRDLLRQAAARGVNAPLSSSVGRLFDAVAALCGLTAESQSYEGEAAMCLEAIAAPMGHGAYRFGAGLDPAPMFADLLADLGRGTDRGIIAARFHDGLAAAFAEEARALVVAGRTAAVALSGGVMANARLMAAFEKALTGLPVLRHSRLPAGDGGLALGQAVVALAQAQAANHPA